MSCGVGSIASTLLRTTFSPAGSRSIIALLSGRPTESSPGPAPGICVLVSDDAVFVTVPTTVPIGPPASGNVTPPVLGSDGAEVVGRDGVSTLGNDGVDAVGKGDVSTLGNDGVDGVDA